MHRQGYCYSDNSDLRTQKCFIHAIVYVTIILDSFRYTVYMVKETTIKALIKAAITGACYSSSKLKMQHNKCNNNNGHRA